MKKIRFVCLLALCLLSFNSFSFGQLSFTGNGTQTIDFSGTIAGVNNGAYSGVGFTPIPSVGQLDSDAWAVTGWSDGNLAFGETRTTGDYARGSTAGAVTTGGFYAYTGLPGSASNPSFLIQPGGNDFAPGTLTLRIQNNGTVNLISFDISYNIFVRNDQGRANSFNFSHSTDNITYTSVPALDYTTPEAADMAGYVQVGTSPSRTTTITGLNILPGEFFYIRWSSADVSGSGSRDEIALDDISVTATFAPSSASGTVGGRVKDSKGNGLKFVTVMITGGGLPEPLYTTTNQFGKYLFEDIPLGENYVLQVFSRRYSFEQNSRIVNMKDYIDDADFIGGEF